LQLRVLRLGFLQDGDVGIGVFPETEEVFSPWSRLTDVLATHPATAEFLNDAVMRDGLGD
jgi:hypothetical protein